VNHPGTRDEPTSGLEDIHIRRVADEEFDAYGQAIEAAFGSELSPARLELERSTYEPDRFLGAFTAQGEIVGSSGAFSFELALPGGTTAGCAGVTAVAVRQDHRRRGLLTAMMLRLLEQADERGEPFAALWASEGGIYGRYGFGPAIPTTRIEVARDRLVLRDPVATDEVRVIDATAAVGLVGELYGRARSQRPGLLSRSAAWWHRLLVHDPADERDGAGPRTIAVLRDGGYVVYRLQPHWERDVPCGTVRVEELVSLHPQATAQLWTFLAATDLAVTIMAPGRPTDDPLRSMVVDPAHVHVRSGSPVYLRILDVPAALAARHYPVDERIVLDVTDRLFPERSGTFEVVVSDGVAQVTPTDADADLALGIEELGMLYLGGVRPTMLRQAGRVEQRRSDAVARCERLLAWDQAPMQCSEF